MRRAVKRRSNRLRMAGRDSVESCSVAARAPASSSTTKPVTPFSITSGIAPRL